MDKQWEESKHPRDEDGKFTSAGGTPAEHKRLKELGIETKEQQHNDDYKSTEKLEKQVDEVLNGKFKDSHITLCDETPKILQSIGVPNKPMLMTAKHAYLVINKNGKYVSNNDHYHDLGKEIFLNIPKFLESPIMVFKNHNNKNEIISIINALDKTKNPVILPIKINGSGRQNFIQIDANIAKSAYGKSNLQNYIDKNVKEEDILLIENKKIRNLNSN